MIPTNIDKIKKNESLQPLYSRRDPNSAGLRIDLKERVVEAMIDVSHFDGLWDSTKKYGYFPDIKDVSIWEPSGEPDFKGQRLGEPTLKEELYEATEGVLTIPLPHTIDKDALIWILDDIDVIGSLGEVCDGYDSETNRITKEAKLKYGLIKDKLYKIFPSYFPTERDFVEVNVVTFNQGQFVKQSMILPVDTKHFYQKMGESEKRLYLLDTMFGSVEYTSLEKGRIRDCGKLKIDVFNNTLSLFDSDELPEEDEE